MIVATFALLLFAALYLAVLILMIVLAINAKSTAGRVGSILVGLVLLVVVPLFFAVATFTVRMESPQQATLSSDQRSATVDLEESETSTLSEIDSVGESSQSPPASSPAPRPPVPPPILEPAGETLASDSPSNDTRSSERASGTWRTTDTETFTANVYPSYASAINPLLTGLREKLVEKQVLERDENDEVINPETIVVSAVGTNLESLLPQITERIGQQFPGTVVRSVDTVPTARSENQLSVHLVVSATSSQPATWDPQQRVENGLLTCTIQVAQRQTSFQAFVTEKPWVESFDQFVSMHPQRNFVVGYSGELQSSEGQARQEALSDAVRQAAISVRGRPHAIIDERHVIDRFAQRLSRSYGDVWREAVLVEVPGPQQVSEAKITAAEAFQRSSKGKLMQAVGMIVLVIVTILLCLALNWVTQGYYRSQVVLGLAGVVIMGFLLAVMFIA